MPLDTIDIGPHPHPIKMIHNNFLHVNLPKEKHQKMFIYNQLWLNGALKKITSLFFETLSNKPCCWWRESGVYQLIWWFFPFFTRFYTSQVGKRISSINSITFLHKQFRSLCKLLDHFLDVAASETWFQMGLKKPIPTSISIDVRQRTRGPVQKSRWRSVAASPGSTQPFLFKKSQHPRWILWSRIYTLED